MRLASPRKHGRTACLLAIALSLYGACTLPDVKVLEDGRPHDAGNGHSHTPSASAMLLPKSDNTTLAGTAVFSGKSGIVSVKVDLAGVPPGDHGLHIHETGDCSAADALSAGGHWNPRIDMHGAPGATATSHLGDIGNIAVAADGTATHTATNALWEIGTGTTMDVRGKAVIIHAEPDDLTTQPTGNAGARIGCGVIR